jgi:hypothetical protein|tara:strand:- start:90 stop:467 length:378 start_codon:yes stop_codon:yes gene_type:complete
MTRKVKSDSVKLDNVVIETDKGQEFTVGEIKHSNRIVKSATPKQDLSWYVKWISSAFIFTAVMFRTVNVPDDYIATVRMWDQIMSLLGCAGWTWVGFLWKDRALILLNSVIVFTLAVGILNSIFN